MRRHITVSIGVIGGDIVIAFLEVGATPAEELELELVIDFDNMVDPIHFVKQIIKLIIKWVNLLTFNNTLTLLKIINLITV